MVYLMLCHSKILNDVKLYTLLDQGNIILIVGTKNFCLWLWLFWLDCLALPWLEFLIPHWKDDFPLSTL